MPKRNKYECRPMRQFERRAAGAYPYYKLAVWNPVTFSWQDGRRAHDSEQAATADARKPGRYRISAVHEEGRRIDGQPFEV